MSYYSPLVFGRFTATIYAPLSIVYIWVNPVISILYMLLGVLSLVFSTYLHGGKAFVVCIFTGCSGLYMIISLMHYELITELTTLLLIGAYLVLFSFYTVSAFDAIIDDYMFEVMTGKLCCMTKYSCYQVGIRIIGASMCEFGDKLIWNERYCYMREEYNGRLNTIDNWVNNVNSDITYESNNLVVHMWVLDKVDKYW